MELKVFLTCPYCGHTQHMLASKMDDTFGYGVIKCFKDNNIGCGNYYAYFCTATAETYEIGTNDLGMMGGQNRNGGQT